jgi:two-component sensor histidine kinase
MAQHPEAGAEEARDLRLALIEKDVLFAELEHRTRNNLQMIVGLIALTARQARHPEAKAALQDIMRRVQMVDAAERALFSRAAFDRVDLADFLPEVVNELIVLDGRPQVQTEIAVEHVETSVRQASALALIVNELATNALKHAFPDDQGVLRLELRPIAQARAQIVVVDSGVGIADPSSSRRQGMGTRIVEGLCRQAGAELTVTSAGGTRAIVEFEPAPTAPST